MSEHLIDDRKGLPVGDGASDEMAMRDLFDNTAPRQSVQDVEQLIIAQVAAYKALSASNREAAGRRTLVHVIANIAGTGIKAGMVGAVTETQTPGNRNPSFTDLAGTTYLVRFARKPLEVWAELQPEPLMHLPIGAELWLRETEVEVIPSES